MVFLILTFFSVSFLDWRWISVISSVPFFSLIGSDFSKGFFSGSITLVIIRSHFLVFFDFVCFFDLFSSFVPSDFTSSSFAEESEDELEDEFEAFSAFSNVFLIIACLSVSSFMSEFDWSWPSNFWSRSGSSAPPGNLAFKMVIGISSVSSVLSSLFWTDFFTVTSFSILIFWSIWTFVFSSGFFDGSIPSAFGDFTWRAFCSIFDFFDLFFFFFDLDLFLLSGNFFWGTSFTESSVPFATFSSVGFTGRVTSSVSDGGGVTGGNAGGTNSSIFAFSPSSVPSMVSIRVMSKLWSHSVMEPLIRLKYPNFKWRPSVGVALIFSISSLRADFKWVSNNVACIEFY